MAQGACAAFINGFEKVIVAQTAGDGSHAETQSAENAIAKATEADTSVATSLAYRNHSNDLAVVDDGELVPVVFHFLLEVGKAPLGVREEIHEDRVHDPCDGSVHPGAPSGVCSPRREGPRPLARGRLGCHT